MKIKQTLKQFLIGIAVVISSGIGLFAAQPVFAASCGGVETSIISCAQSTQTGACTGGELPSEGTKPTTDAEKKAYVAKYSHDYGLCKGGAVPALADTSSNGVWGLLLLVINILTAGVGLAAVGGIIYGSILYTSAGGSQEQVKKAMGIITNVVIGIIAYALMFAFLNFLIPGGLFN